MLGESSRSKASKLVVQEKQQPPSFRAAPLGAGPESITTIVSMDSCCARPGMTIEFDDAKSRLTGKSPPDGQKPVQPLAQKYSAFAVGQISGLTPPVSSPRGALAIVTDVGRDAVDADAPLTNGADADGEVVWS